MGRFSCFKEGFSGFHTLIEACLLFFCPVSTIFFTSSLRGYVYFALLKPRILQRISESKKVICMQKMSPCMNVRGAVNLSAYLYDVRAASSRFSFAHYYALHAIPWGLSHAVAIFFPEIF